MQIRERGSALVQAMIVMLAVTVLGVGLVRFASREAAGSAAARNQEALTACADAGRQILQSQFRTFGDPVTIKTLDTLIDNPTEGRTRALGGHVDNVSVTQVELLEYGSLGGGKAMSGNLTWSIGGLGSLGNKPFKVMVHCQDAGDGSPTSGRQLEVEFGVRFGL